MSYFTPYVDETGYHYPSYEEILDDLVTSIQTIYGSGIYLGSDSQDYQILSIFALKIYDAYQAVELAYNAHSPLTAIGTCLDYIVALNGLKRLQGTQPIATVTLSGAAGTVIQNGVVSDVAGILWDLPETVTLDTNGEAAVTATCRETGVYAAAPNTITRIMTPTIGWISVTNATAATTGTSVESDSALRARQVTSVAQPSRTILAGLKGALLALDYVSRVEVYENDTDETTGKIPPQAHSIYCIIDYDYANTSEHNARRKEICETILKYKSCGCGTYGTGSYNVTDEETGVTYTINYKKMESVEIDVKATVAPTSAYSQAYQDKIKLALVEYLNSLTAGQDVSATVLTAVVMNCNDDLRVPAFTVSSVQVKRHTADSWDSSVTLSEPQAAHGIVDNMQVIDGLGS